MKYIDIWATWCGPCKKMEPIIEEIEQEYNIDFEKLDADKEMEFLTKHQIQSVPTYLVLDDNDTVIKRTVGYQSKTKLVQSLGL